MKLENKYFYSTILLFLITVNVFAGMTGKIAGKVSDQASDEPLPGANVIIYARFEYDRDVPLDPIIGTATDINGDFIMINIAPGLYTLKAQMLGYEEYVVKDVFVSIDRTTHVNFPMSTTVLEGREVVVVADREMIRKDVANSMKTISAKDLAATPKKSFADMLTVQSGIEQDAYGVTIRGGTEKEVSYIVDGVSMADNRTNRPYTNINTELIEELQLITGGFSAEYGQARSGVVNIVSKRSKAGYHGSINLRDSPASIKHFGPNMWTKDNWWDFGRFQHMEAIPGDMYTNELGETVQTWTDENGDNIDRDKDGIPDFRGWKAYAESKSNSDKLTADDCLKLWKYQHRNDDFAEELGVDPVLSYGNTDDMDIQTSFMGPLWPFKNIHVPILSEMDFLFGYSKRQTAYTFQLSRDKFTEDNAQLNLNYQVSDQIEIGFMGMYGETHACGWFMGADHSYITNPGYIIQNTYGAWASQGYYNVYAVDNNSNFIDWYRSKAALTLKHVLSPKSFYEVILQYSSTDYNANPPEFVEVEPYLSESGSEQLRYASEFSLINTEGDTINYPTFPRGYDYNLYPGVSGQNIQDQNGYYLHFLLDSWGYDESSLETWTAKFDLTRQIGQHHEIKTGFLIDDNHVIENRWAAYPRITDKFGNLVGAAGTHFNVKFLEGGFYFQDKMEFPGFVLSAGLRFDFYQAESPMADIWNNPFRPDLYGHFMREAFFDSLDVISADVPLKTAWSPRLGIAHPISDVSKLYFNYGHFSQSPATHNLYWLRYGGAPNGGRMEFVGNPWLPLSKTVSYEIGYEHDLLRRLNINFSGYYKDARNQPQFVWYNPGTAESMWFSYQDYSYWTMKGMEGNIKLRNSKYLNGFLNFSYFLTTFGTTGPTLVRPDDEELHNDHINDQSMGLAKRSFEPVMRAKAGLNFSIPKTFGTSIAGINPFGNWRINWIFKWKQGAKFHWDPTNLSDESILNYKWRDYLMVDLKIDRQVKLGSSSFSLYCDVFNLFNLKNFNVTDFGESVYEGVDYYQTPGSARYTFFAYGKDGNLEFDRYMTRIEASGKTPGDEVEQAYMPKREYMTYLFPRDIWIGIRIAF